MTITTILQLLVGPSGRYYHGLWTPCEVLAHLFAPTKIAVTDDYATRIIDGKHPVPHRYTSPLRAKDGLATCTDNIYIMMQHCPCDAMCLDIHHRIHTAVVTSDLSPAQIQAINQYYVSHNPTTYDISCYLAHVLRAVLCN